MLSIKFASRQFFRTSAMRAAPRRRLATILLPALACFLAAVAGLLWLPTDPAQAQTEQSERPTITAGPVITSSPANGHTYGQGQVIQVAVAFSEAVTVTGEPRVRLTMGDRTRWARYASSSSDGTVLTFTYSVKGNDQDENGISIKKNQLELRDGSIADADGNAAKLKHPALPDQSAHKVDGAPPFITAGPVITSSPASGDAYGEGEAIAVAVTFSEAVTASGDVRVPLAVGERQRWARYSHSEPDGTVLFFAYQVKKVDADSNGVSIGANRLQLRDGSIVDAGGNAANLEHSALADQSGHQVNGSPEPEPTPTPTPTPTPAPPSNSPPRFDAESVALSVAEDAAIGANVGNAITATDAENDALIYAISGSNAFAVNSASGQITVQTALDYETQSIYSLTVSVSDGQNAGGDDDASVDDTIAVTVNVGNVDEAGVVSLESEPDPPEVGSELRATLLDPDGGVSGLSWSWQRSADGTAWDNVAGASGATYTLAGEDAAHYLRATASYTDAHGPSKTARGALEEPALATVTVQQPQAQAQTKNSDGSITVWSATLTVSTDLAGSFGCSDRYINMGNCSTSTVLTDNNFTYKGVTYTVRELYLAYPSITDQLHLRFEGDGDGFALRNALSSLTLNVDGIPLNITGAEVPGGYRGVLWHFYPSTRWTTEGRTVSLSLTTLPPPPPQGREIWSAALTVDKDEEYFGCENGEGDQATQDNCSSSSVLTEDDFTYRGVKYVVDHFFWNSSNNEISIGFSSDDGTDVIGSAARTALSSLTLNVGESVFAISDASVGDNTQTYLAWAHDPDPDWTDGQTVSLSLVEPPPEIWSATLTVDEAGSPHGCDNTDAAHVHDCWPSALTDDEFTYRGVTYTIDGVVWQNPSGNHHDTHDLTLILYANQGRTPTGDELKNALRLLTLNVDGYWLPVSEAKAGSGPKLTWKQNLPWTDGTQASLSLHTIGEPTCETPTSTGTRCMVPRDWWLLPSGAGLDPGESFRLMFVTSTGTAATETAVGPYNTFVQNRADAVADLKPLKDHFRALVSTAAVAARANTLTRSGDLGDGDPIYWVEGPKIADGYADLYDGSWDYIGQSGQHPTRENGAELAGAWQTWTGSKPDGTAQSGYEVGSDRVMFAHVNTSGRTLGAAAAVPSGGGRNVAAKATAYSLYAISPALTVDYDPAAPLQPTGLTASPRDTAVRLKWDEPWYEDPYPDKRQVQWRAHDGTSWGSWGEWQDISPHVGAHVSNGLTNGMKYQFRIRTVVGTHYSAPSEPAEATPQEALLKPTGLVANPADRAVILHWDYPDNDAITVYQYRYRRKTDGNNAAWDAWTTMPGNSSLDHAAYTVRLSQNDQPLEFKVRAGTGAGNTLSPYKWGAESEVVSVTPEAAPGPVAAVSVPHDWERLPRASDKETIVVAPGESFRLLFITRGTGAASTRISEYNTFVQEDAARTTGISEFKDGFRAMISTAGVNARDNTATVQVSDSAAPPTVTTVWSDELTVTKAKEGNEYGCNQAWASGRCADLDHQHFGFGGTKYTIDLLYWSSSDNRLVLKITGAANAAAEDALYALTLQVGDNEFAMGDGTRTDASDSNDFQISWDYNPDPDWAAGQGVELSLTLPIFPTDANSPPVFWIGGKPAVLAGGDPYDSDDWVVSTTAGDDDRVWTGSFRGGYSWSVYQHHHYAGAKHVRVGDHSTADNHIHIDADNGTPHNTTRLPLYAISPVSTKEQPPSQ